MISFFRDAANKGVQVTHTLEDEYATYVDRAIPQKIIDGITKQWIDKYGADVLEALKPDEVAKAVERAVKETMANKIFGDTK
jgi:hypothetical protein